MWLRGDELGDYAISGKISSDITVNLFSGQGSTRKIGNFPLRSFLNSKVLSNTCITKHPIQKREPNYGTQMTRYGGVKIAPDGKDRRV